LLIGVKTNRDFLRHIILQPEFVKHTVTTDYIANNEALLKQPQLQITARIYALAAFALIQQRRKLQQQKIEQSPEPNSPWNDLDNWRLNEAHQEVIKLKNQTEERVITVATIAKELQFKIADEIFHISGTMHKNKLKAIINNHATEIITYFIDNIVYLLEAGEIYQFIQPVAESESEADAKTEGSLTAPMPGTITALFVKTGAKVTAGDKLLIMEAMKMEHTIFAPRAGKVNKINFNQGDLVDEGMELIDII